MKKLETDILQFIDECMENEHPDSYLIAVLHKIQGRYGYLCDDHKNQVAQLMHDDVVDTVLRHLDQFQVERDFPDGGAASPA